MKGVFRLRPPKRKYCATWNVQEALSYVESLEPIEDLTLKQLTYKSILLVALTTAARAHELAGMDLKYRLQKESEWEFSLEIHVKTSWPGHQGRRIYLKAFPDNQKICIIRTLMAYILRTKDIRTSSKLFISYVAPHRAIWSQTISRWLSKDLRLAGIPLHYTGYSTRGASTSAAAEAGLPIPDIMEAADWASSRTFEQFYHRNTSVCPFSRAVLNNHQATNDS